MQPKSSGLAPAIPGAATTIPRAPTRMTGPLVIPNMSAQSNSQSTGNLYRPLSPQQPKQPQQQTQQTQQAYRPVLQRGVSTVASSPSLLSSTSPDSSSRPSVTHSASAVSLPPPEARPKVAAYGGLPSDFRSLAAAAHSSNNNTTILRTAPPMPQSPQLQRGGGEPQQPKNQPSSMQQQLQEETNSRQFSNLASRAGANHYGPIHAAGQDSTGFISTGANNVIRQSGGGSLNVNDGSAAVPVVGGVGHYMEVPKSGLKAQAKIAAGPPKTPSSIASLPTSNVEPPKTPSAVASLPKSAPALNNNTAPASEHTAAPTEPVAHPASHRAGKHIAANDILNNASSWSDPGYDEGPRIAMRDGIAVCYETSTDVISLVFSNADQSSERTRPLGTLGEVAARCQVKESGLEVLLMSEKGDYIAIVLEPVRAVSETFIHVLLVSTSADSLSDGFVAQLTLKRPPGPLLSECCVLVEHSVVGSMDLSFALLVGNDSGFYIFKLSGSRSHGRQVHLSSTLHAQASAPARTQLYALRFLSDSGSNGRVFGYCNDGRAITYEVAVKAGDPPGSEVACCDLPLRFSSASKATYLGLGLAGTVVFFGGTDGTVVAVDSNGEEFWFHKLAGRTDAVSCILARAPVLFIAYNSGLIILVDLNEEIGSEVSCEHCDVAKGPVVSLTLQSYAGQRKLSACALASSNVQPISWNPEYLFGQALFFTDAARNIQEGAKLWASADQVFRKLAAAEDELLSVGAMHALPYVSELVVLVDIIRYVGLQLMRAESVGVPSGLVNTALSVTDALNAELQDAVTSRWLARIAANPRLQLGWWERLIYVLRASQAIYLLIRECREQQWANDMYADHWAALCPPRYDLLPDKLLVSWAAVEKSVLAAYDERCAATAVDLYRSVFDGHRLGFVSCTRLLPSSVALPATLVSMLPLPDEAWFYGFLTQREAALVLLTEPDGSFIVHFPAPHLLTICISFKSQGGVGHLTAEVDDKVDGGLTVRATSDDESDGNFSSVSEIISAYRSFLVYPVPRMDAILADYFGGDMSSDDVARILRGLPVGSWLVRYSSQGSPAVSFSQQDGTNMSVLIHRGEGHKGFYVTGGEDWVFDSCAALIQGYKDNAVLADKSACFSLLETWKSQEDVERERLEASEQEAASEIAAYEDRARLWVEEQMAKPPAPDVMSTVAVVAESASATTSTFGSLRSAGLGHESASERHHTPSSDDFDTHSPVFGTAQRDGSPPNANVPTGIYAAAPPPTLQDREAILPSTSVIKPGDAMNSATVYDDHLEQSREEFAAPNSQAVALDNRTKAPDDMSTNIGKDQLAFQGNTHDDRQLASSEDEVGSPKDERNVLAEKHSGSQETELSIQPLPQARAMEACVQLSAYVMDLRAQLVDARTYEQCLEISQVLRQISQAIDSGLAGTNITTAESREWIICHPEVLPPRLDSNIPEHMQGNERACRLISVGGLVVQKIVGILAFMASDVIERVGSLNSSWIIRARDELCPSDQELLQTSEEIARFVKGPAQVVEDSARTVEEPVRQEELAGSAAVAPWLSIDQTASINLTEDVSSESLEGGTVLNFALAGSLPSDSAQGLAQSKEVDHFNGKNHPLIRPDPDQNSSAHVVPSDSPSTLPVSGDNARRLSDDNILDPERRERLRRAAVEEIVRSEREYVNDLNQILSVWLFPIRIKGVLSDLEMASIFGNIETLINVNSQLLMEWETTTRGADEEGRDVGEAIGTVFNQIVPYLKMYTSYCANYPSAVVQYSDLQRKNKPFAKTIKICETDSRAHGLTLMSFLIKPVQRLCKYPLLFRELLKHTPENHESISSLKATEDQLAGVVEYVNERKREAENLQRIVDIQSTLVVPSAVNKNFSHACASGTVGLNPDDAAALVVGATKDGLNLVDAARRFLTDGDLRCIEASKRGTPAQVKAWLFSDVLLIASPVRIAGRGLAARLSTRIGDTPVVNAAATHELKVIFPLSAAAIVNVSDTPERTNVIEIHSTVVNGKIQKKASAWALLCESAGNKDHWIKHLKDTKKDLQQRMYDEKFGKKNEAIQTHQKESVTRELALEEKRKLSSSTGSAGSSSPLPNRLLARSATEQRAGAQFAGSSPTATVPFQDSAFSLSQSLDRDTFTQHSLQWPPHSSGEHLLTSLETSDTLQNGGESSSLPQYSLPSYNDTQAHWPPS